jgi:glycosyltransferase involved in cell wall biosynthesis
LAKLKVLYVLHNHPIIRRGGAEAYTLELYETMRDSDDFEPTLLARVGTSNAPNQPFSHPGTPFSIHETDPNQCFVATDLDNFDQLQLTLHDKSLYMKHFVNFLLAHRPDVVHFQHTLFLGYDLIPQTRMTLPEAPILYTLHDYWPICNREGQLLRTREDELCLLANPRRCNECFPSISPQSFFLRTRFIKSRLADVDLFLAPSHFLRERYIDWGIPEEKIRFEDYGRLPVERAPIYADEGRPRTRLAFIGQLNRHKGINVLLEAMSILKELEPQARLWLHAANLESQSEDFQEEFRQLLDRARDNVTFRGGYDHATLPRLMADVDWIVVPSIWWENSPLVIQEAFLHGRPVICSGVGGMAEKVTDAVNGLHFRVGDPLSLAQALRRAVSTPGLWDKLRGGIPDVFSMDEHIANLGHIYRELLERRRSEVGAHASLP